MFTYVYRPLFEAVGVVCGKLEADAEVWWGCSAGGLHWNAAPGRSAPRDNQVRVLYSLVECRSDSCIASICLCLMARIPRYRALRGKGGYAAACPQPHLF